MQIIFEDERLLAVAKPAGQPTIPGRGDVGEALSDELSRLQGKKIFVVHRLDRTASGLVVFAKSATAHVELCGLFEKRRVRKTYLAAVLGKVPKAGEISSKLREFGSGRVGVDEKAGKHCLTRYKPKEPLGGATLLEIDLVTGRKHQIRAHLCSIGHPILGDDLYGEPRPVGGATRLMLHAWKLAIHQGPTLVCEPGPDFTSILKSRAR
jgi:tRNA pseudouridine32 synthase / 23S rRNA pseudouridine746 synthase